MSSLSIMLCCFPLLDRCGGALIVFLDRFDHESTFFYSLYSPNSGLSACPSCYIRYFTLDCRSPYPEFIILRTFTLWNIYDQIDLPGLYIVDYVWTALTNLCYDRIRSKMRKKSVFSHDLGNEYSYDIPNHYDLENEFDAVKQEYISNKTINAKDLLNDVNKELSDEL